MEKNEPESLAGLMDTGRVAAYLGIAPERIRTWVARQGEGGGRIANIFPRPLATDGEGSGEPGLLNRGFVWRKTDIVDFAKVFADYKPAGGRQSAKP